MFNTKDFSFIFLDNFIFYLIINTYKAKDFPLYVYLFYVFCLREDTHKKSVFFSGGTIKVLPSLH